MQRFRIYENLQQHVIISKLVFPPSLTSKVTHDVTGVLVLPATRLHSEPSLTPVFVLALIASLFEDLFNENEKLMKMSLKLGS